jgi:hypothetical protein
MVQKVLESCLRLCFFFLFDSLRFCLLKIRIHADFYLLKIPIHADFFTYMSNMLTEPSFFLSRLEIVVKLLIWITTKSASSRHRTDVMHEHKLK